MSSSAHCPHPALPPLRCDLVNDVLECMSGDITEEFLRAHLKDEDTDLDKVTEITMRVVKVMVWEGVLSSGSLRCSLAGSYITEARSLGTRLSGLVVLNLSRSHLSDLSGMSSLLPSLQELYLAFNCLTTINGIEWMDSLQIVDLEGNSIPSIDQLSALATCSSVWQLSLEGNPVTRKASLKEILELVPALEVLDDETRVDCVCNTEAMTLTLFDLYRGRRAGSGVTRSGSLTRKVTGAEVREMCPGLDGFLTSQPSDEGCSTTSELADEGSGSEPDELSLVLEETKKRAAGQARSAWGMGGFLSARLPFTASTTASGGDRLTRPCTRDTKPATARSLAHDSAALPSSSSVLTTGGEAFSGSHLKAIRYSKRQQRCRDEKRSPSLEEAGLSIRQLLDKYRIDYVPDSYHWPRRSSGESSKSSRPPGDYVPQN
ncbi:leucine rich repeat containing 56 [Perkinsus olseni]|uniref:Leucine rich repeat containing 56 n=1 Tax=Perkinsus olseni TaxID=32597 RepID=A0A7J6Q9Q4_PEROL|nr:leucine rich repeat containing 56 [Perkinsus olseni]